MHHHLFTKRKAARKATLAAGLVFLLLLPPAQRKLAPPAGKRAKPKTGQRASIKQLRRGICSKGKGSRRKKADQQSRKSCRTALSPDEIGRQGVETQVVQRSRRIPAPSRRWRPEKPDTGKSRTGKAGGKDAEEAKMKRENRVEYRRYLLPKMRKENKKGLHAVSDFIDKKTGGD